MATLGATRRWLALAAAIAMTVTIAASCGDDEPQGDETSATGATGPTGERQGGPEAPASRAFIDPDSGDFAGLRPDTRRGEAIELGASPTPESSAEAAGCELQTDLRDEGTDHLAPGDPTPDYATEPPTSGAHDPIATADGAYLEAPPVTGVVHSLEHGRIAVQYSPDLPEQDQLQLKGLFEADPEGMLLFPNPDTSDAVAATAWTRLLTCDEYRGQATLEALAAFRDASRERGPERVPL